MRIEEALREADDFLTAQMIAQRTKLTASQVAAALANLRHYKAADCMESAGKLWWFAAPLAEDQRQRKFTEIKVDIKRPGRTRRASQTSRKPTEK